MNKTIRTAAAIVCILLIAITGVLIIGKLVGRTRLDLTDHGIYTLSQGSRNVLSGLNQDVRLKLYYAKTAAIKGPESLRLYNNYYVYVRELLEEYAGLAGGKLQLAVTDPRPFTDEEEEALRYGIKRFPLSDNESFYFGLVAESELGKDKVIDFFDPSRQEFVEYEISKLISDVVRREKKKVGVLSFLPVTGSDMSPYMMQMLQYQGRQPEQPWTIVAQMRDAYDVEAVESDADAISGEYDFLIVVHPKSLPQKTLYAIDQYVMRGGKLMVFVDPYCFQDRPPRNPQNPYAGMDYDASSDLNGLLKKWGVEMSAGLFAADRSLALKASVRRDAPPESIVTYMQLTGECVNKEEVITANLHELRILFGGVLKQVESAESTVTPLLTTTPTGNTWKPSAPYEVQMLDPRTVAEAVGVGNEKLMLACRITGKLATNFPDGPPADEVEEEEGDEGDAEAEEAVDEEGEVEAEQPEPVKESPPDAMVIVVADVDMLTDGIAYENTFFGTAQSGDNASLVLNSLEYLSGSGDLIAIRSRGGFARPFKLVDGIERQAEEATSAEVAAVNARIQEYQQKLQDLGKPASEEDLKLLQSTAIGERRKLEDDIRQARKELRRLNAGKREAIEGLGALLQTLNMIIAPAVVLAIAVVLFVLRVRKERLYAERRMEG